MQLVLPVFLPAACVCRATLMVKPICSFLSPLSLHRCSPAPCPFPSPSPSHFQRTESLLRSYFLTAPHCSYRAISRHMVAALELRYLRKRGPNDIPLFHSTRCACHPCLSRYVQCVFFARSQGTRRSICAVSLLLSAASRDWRCPSDYESTAACPPWFAGMITVNNASTDAVRITSSCNVSVSCVLPQSYVLSDTPCDVCTSPLRSLYRCCPCRLRTSLSQVYRLLELCASDFLRSRDKAMMK